MVCAACLSMFLGTCKRRKLRFLNKNQWNKDSGDSFGTIPTFQHMWDRNLNNEKEVCHLHVLFVKKNMVFMVQLFFV